MFAAAAIETFSCAPARARERTSPGTTRKEFFTMKTSVKSDLFRSAAHGARPRRRTSAFRCTGGADSVYEELFAADFSSAGHADNGYLLVGKTGHAAAFQAEKVRMTARAARFLRRIDEVAKRSVDTLNAVHEPGFLEVLEGAEDGHTV